MEIRQLEYFHEIAATGSINRSRKETEHVPAAAKLSDQAAGSRAEGEAFCSGPGQA
mgnify:CR=1 FL=1